MRQIVVAKTAQEALEAEKSYTRYVVAETKRIEMDDAHGGEHRLFVVDEDRTVAVAVSSKDRAIDVAIEVPYTETEIGQRLAEHLLQHILIAKRGVSWG